MLRESDMSYVAPKRSAKMVEELEPMELMTQFERDSSDHFQIGGGMIDIRQKQSDGDVLLRCMFERRRRGWSGRMPKSGAPVEGLLFVVRKAAICLRC
jgi:hypothetical protein